MYSLKCLNINTTKVASYDKLKAEANEAMSEKAHLMGQLNQAIMERDCYKAEGNLSRSENIKKITELVGKIIELKVEVASLTRQLETKHQRDKNASKAFYESEEYLNLENYNTNLGQVEVFYIVWRKYPDLDFSFLGEVCSA